jgi:hypothetical protein
MRVIRASVARVCAVCERTLLQGEKAMRFSAGGQGFVDVCTLCQDVALDHGWVREGGLAASPSLDAGSRRRRQKTLWQALLGAREEEPEPVASEPILRRLSDDEIALVEAAELFNQSSYRRTIVGVARSLGTPNASIVPLSGVNAETVITIAWDITWYQYRVSPEAGQPVRIAERGQDLDEIESEFTAWNATLEEDGRLVPELVRV